MKKILQILLLIPFFLYGQERGFYIDYFPIPVSGQADTFNVLVTYRLANNRLVFTKTATGFEAAFRLTIELKDSLHNLVKREISEHNVTAIEYNSTKDKSIFSEGTLLLRVKKGKYYIQPTIADKNSINEKVLKESSLFLDEINGKVTSPLLYSNKISSTDTSRFELIPMGKFLPFDKKNYGLIFPVSDTNLKEIKVILSQGKDSIKLDLTHKVIGSLSTDFNNHVISCVANGNNKVCLFYSELSIPNIFREAPLNISISDEQSKNKDSVYSTRFVYPVVWFYKPESMSDFEYAIRLLNNFVSQVTVDSMLALPEQNYPIALDNFWKKYDPTPNTAFNELCYLFYSRVDYSNRNFNSLNNKRGSDTDRGKVFIKNGEPNSIKREYISKEISIEKWKYNNGKTYKFVDKGGKGNFELESVE